MDGESAESTEGDDSRRICDIYDFFAPHINVLTYLLTYLRCDRNGKKELRQRRRNWERDGLLNLIPQFTEKAN